MKMWLIYTMEYYSAVKKNEIVKFLGKQIELENNILSNPDVKRQTLNILSHLQKPQYQAQETSFQMTSQDRSSDSQNSIDYCVAVGYLSKVKGKSPYC